MSVLQTEELITYQLRTSYLTEIADGVGERLLTLNDGFLNTGAYKATGWRPDPSLIKRTYSPPIPTDIASEYFQKPRGIHTLEDEPDVFGRAGPAAQMAGPRRRRRRENRPNLEEDSSDLSDDSDEHDPDQGASSGPTPTAAPNPLTNRVQHQREPSAIKFQKMPVRSRAGSSPLQSTNLRPPMPVNASPRSTSTASISATRRGSQSALETVKERLRRDTTTSSEVSSENEMDIMTRQRAAAAKAAAIVARATASRKEQRRAQQLSLGREDYEDDDDDDDDSDTLESGFPDTIDSVSLLDGMVENSMQAQRVAGSPTAQVVGTPPRKFTRRSTIRKSMAPIIPVPSQFFRQHAQ